MDKVRVEGVDTKVAGSGRDAIGKRLKAEGSAHIVAGRAEYSVHDAVKK